jgi:Periplasmic copper-binding protein (NosD)
MQLLLAAVLAAAVALGVPAPAAAAPTSSDHPRTLHVSSTAPGPGDGSAARPYRRISQAVAVAGFGDTHPVGLRASLEVRNTVLRLRSEPRRFVGLEARCGRLEITDSTVTSWAPSAGRPDDLAGDGRAWVLARDGSVMNVTRSRMERLDYDRAERSGVAWRTRRTSGTVSRSVFAGNWDGAHLHGGRNLQIEDNVFRHNARNGMVLAASCANATVRGTSRTQTTATAWSWPRAATTSPSPATRSTTTGGRASTSTTPWACACPRTSSTATSSASTSTAGARSVVADATRLTANRLDALRVSSGATQITASRNLIDFNHRAGVFLAEGAAEIGPANRLLDNEMGVWLSRDARGAEVTDNGIEANVLDGVHLAGLRVGLIRGNTIRANRKAAFSVAVRGSARPFFRKNQVVGNPVRERLRVEGHPAG